MTPTEPLAVISFQELDRLREIEKQFKQLKEQVSTNAQIVLKVVERPTRIDALINPWGMKNPPIPPPLNIAYRLVHRDEELQFLIDTLNQERQRLKQLEESEIPAGIHFKSRKVKDVVMIL